MEAGSSRVFNQRKRRARRTKKDANEEELRLDSRSTGGWIRRGGAPDEPREGEQGARGGVPRGLRRVKRTRRSRWTLCRVIYFPSLPRRGRTKRRIDGGWNTTRWTYRTFHLTTPLRLVPSSSCGVALRKPVKISRKSTPHINHVYRSRWSSQDRPSMNGSTDRLEIIFTRWWPFVVQLPGLSSLWWQCSVVGWYMKWNGSLWGWRFTWNCEVWFSRYINISSFVEIWHFLIVKRIIVADIIKYLGIVHLCVVIGIISLFCISEAWGWLIEERVDEFVNGHL